MADALKDILRLVDLVRNADEYEKHMLAYKAASDKATMQMAEAAKLREQLEADIGNFETKRATFATDYEEYEAKEAALAAQATAFGTAKADFDAVAKSRKEALERETKRLSAQQKALTLSQLELNDAEAKLAAREKDLAKREARYQAVIDMLRPED